MLSNCVGLLSVCEALRHSQDAYSHLDYHVLCSLDSRPYWLIQGVAPKGLNLRVMDASLCKGMLLPALKESGLHTFAFGWRGEVLKSVVADSSRCSWKIPFS